MLLLTRRVGEKVVIGEGIEVTIAAVRGRQVRIGVAAPPAVRVARRELLEDRPEELGGEAPTGDDPPGEGPPADA